MTKYILSKEVGEVAETNLRTGIRVIFKDNSWYFPSDALELVEDNVQITLTKEDSTMTEKVRTLADEDNIEIGDIIECIDDDDVHYWTTGKQYVVVDVDEYGDIAVFDNDGDHLYIELDGFKLVSKAVSKEQQSIVEPVIISEDALESLITECSLYFDEVSVYIDKPEDKIEYTLQIDGYKFVGTKEYVVSKMKGAIEWMKP